MRPLTSFLLILLFFKSTNAEACRRHLNSYSAAHIKAIADDFSREKKYKNFKIKSIIQKSDSIFWVDLSGTSNQVIHLEYELESLTNCHVKAKKRIRDLKKNTLSSQSKYRQECALTSEKFKKNPPTKLVDVWCADDKRSDLGDVGPDIIHAVTAAAFYEKRLDRRKSAMSLLESYECKNKKTCTEFYSLLERGLESKEFKQNNKSLLKRAHNIKSKVSKKLKSL